MSFDQQKQYKNFHLQLGFGKRATFLSFTDLPFLFRQEQSGPEKPLMDKLVRWKIKIESVPVYYVNII